MSARSESRERKSAKKEESSNGKGSDNDKGIMAKLPPAVVRALRNKRKWKDWFRAMIVIFVCMVYLVVQDTLVVLGQAAFFSCELL
jgi:hypothetical protein